MGDRKVIVARHLCGCIPAATLDLDIAAEEDARFFADFILGALRQGAALSLVDGPVVLGRCAQHREPEAADGR